MIAGFCGETEEDHAATLDLLERVGYEQAFLYAYSLRDKTHAARHYQVRLVPLGACLLGCAAAAAAAGCLPASQCRRRRSCCRCGRPAVNQELKTACLSTHQCHTTT